MDAIDELCASDCVIHDPFHGRLDRNGFRDLVNDYQSRFGDMQLREDELIEAGDKVMIRWSGQGRANGKSMSVCGLSLLTIRNGKLAEQWSAWDVPQFGEALGLTPRGTQQGMPAERPSAPA